MSEQATASSGLDIEDTSNDYLASFVWESGYLAAAFFNLQTMELLITYEGIDLRPDFFYMQNLYRQFKCEYVVASGNYIFVTEVMRMLNIPLNEDRKKFKATCRGVTGWNFTIFPIDDKSLSRNLQRIKHIQLPGMRIDATDEERTYFIQSIIPVNQNRVVNALGNLMQYLDMNWRRLFLCTDNHPEITDLRVFYLESQLLMDQQTYESLQIFSSKQHPAGFKRGASNSSVEGFSLFNIINSFISSKMGSNELKLILQQPTRDIDELNLRFATINWCINATNYDMLQRLKAHIKRMTNVTSVFGRIAISGGKPSEWKALRACIYSVFTICDLIKDLSKEQIANTLLEDLVKVLSESNLEDVYLIVDRIFDIEESVKQRKFVVQPNFNPELDDKKRQLVEVQTQMFDLAKEDLSYLPNFIHEFEMLYMPGFEFVIAIPFWGESPNAKEFQNDTMQYVFMSADKYYFKTDLCRRFDSQYGHLYSEICEQEKRICNRLIKYIRENLADIQHVVKLCSKLDCMIAFAELAIKRSYVRPELTTSKIIDIKNGRHPLLEVNSNFTANDTKMCFEDKNIVTILNSPNASGKSVYLRQVALIAFMAHIGSYVPATTAKMQILDGIHSKIYSSESVFLGTSSYLSDLQQMARVMTTSTSQSLVVLDEFGKGTELDVGRALLLACIDGIISCKDLSPFTIISTHFHNVYDDIQNKENVTLKTFEVIEEPNSNTLVSTYKLKTGRGREIYAIHLPETRRFIESLFADGNGSSSTVDNSKGDFNRNYKIRFAYEILMKYLESNAITSKEVEDIIRMTNVASFMNETNN